MRNKVWHASDWLRRKIKFLMHSRARNEVQIGGTFLESSWKLIKKNLGVYYCAFHIQPKDFIDISSSHKQKTDFYYFSTRCFYTIRGAREEKRRKKAANNKTHTRGISNGGKITCCTIRREARCTTAIKSKSSREYAQICDTLSLLW